MKFRANVQDIKEVHELIRYDPGHQVHRVEIELHETTNPNETRVTAKHRKGESATIPISASAAEICLATALGHYPIPVTLNGEDVPRADVDDRPAIYLNCPDRPCLAAPEERRGSRLADTRITGNAVLCDGILYGVTGTEYLIETRQGGADPRLQPFEHALCTTPGWEPDHLMPAETYRIEHNLVYTTTTPDEREGAIFALCFNAPYFQPRSGNEPQLVEQQQRTWERIRQHAQSTDRELVQPEEAKAAVTLWSPGYGGDVAILARGTRQVAISENASQGVQWAISEALMQQQEYALAPVRHRQGIGELTATSVSYTTLDGVRRHHGIHWGTQAGDEMEGASGGAEFCPARDIIVTAVLSTDADDPEGIDISVPMLPMGWRDLPHIIFDVDRIGTTEEATYRLACAYTNWKSEHDDYRPTRRAAEVLAARMIEGEAAGFEKALRQLADSFQPGAEWPEAAVTVMTGDGKHLCTWSPAADGSNQQ